MERRSFVKKSVLASSAALTSASLFSNTLIKKEAVHKFKLKYAPHAGMFKHHAGADILDQLKFMIDQGFTAFEDNEMRNRPVKLQEDIAKLMKDNHMEMGVFVAHKIYWKDANLASGNKEFRDEFLKDIQNSVAVAKRTNAKWMTVVPGHVDLRQDDNYQTANVIEALKQASEILEPYDITMVLEPLNFGIIRACF